MTDERRVTAPKPERRRRDVTALERRDVPPSDTRAAAVLVTEQPIELVVHLVSDTHHAESGHALEEIDAVVDVSFILPDTRREAAARTIGGA